MELTSSIRVNMEIRSCPSFGNITSISGSSLPPRLHDLYFYNQPLTNISDDAFNSSAQTLTSLNIVRASFRQLPKALFVLTKLNFLQIKDTPLEKWNDSILERIVTKVRILNLPNVGLTAWPGSISSSHQIAELDLSNNPLKYVPEDAFLSFKDTLESLSLANTSLTQVPQALSTLSNLTDLDLSGNSLTNAQDIEQLASMPFGRHLMYFVLDSSALDTLLNLSSFTSLLYVSLNNNNISNASSGSFPLSLTDLWLQGNHLPSVPTTIATLSHLSVLDLSSNEIRRIEPGSLPSGLTRLDLTHNRLTEITNTTFQNMTNLSSLRLDENPITTIQASAFTDLVSLDYLLIDGRNLREIPLAITSLPVDIDLTITIGGDIPCSCPPPQELVQWWSKHNNSAFIGLECLTFMSIERYLTTGCLPTTTAALATTSPGGATSLKPSLVSIPGSGLLMMAVLVVLH